jgi:hypothetical protein
MAINAGSIIVFFILIVTAGCNLSSGTAGDEIIYAPTEVGTPVGEKVTKDIGLGGGTLSSPDGRLTLTVPPNTVSQTVSFAIQPITNKAVNGRGAAFRLEPDGMTFTTPVKVSIRYDDKDVEGTVPEALAVAYQDKQGGWHAQRSGQLDQTDRTYAISTTHFTDFAVLARLWLSPTELKIHPGDLWTFSIVLCDEPGLLDRLLSRPASCRQVSDEFGVFTLSGPGQIKEIGEEKVIYTAPGREPNPNTAWLTYTFYKFGWTDEIQSYTTVKHELFAKITIVDRGYRVSGQGDWLVTFSGVICSLEKPFIVYGSAYNYNLNFTPSSDSNGTWTVDTYIDVGKYNGGGTYSIENIDSDKPRIKVMGDATVTVAGRSIRTGSGTFYLDLEPIDTDECGGK